MMTYLYFIFVSFCLIIIQTTIMPFIPLFDRFYDLLCPFVIYLGLYRSVREGLPIVFFCGLMMDGLFGGPFGLYVTTYIWIFIGVKWMLTFLQLNNIFLLLFIIVLGVLLENLIFIGALTMLAPGLQFPSDAIRIVGMQVLWAICTGPFILMWINYAQKGWITWYNKQLAKRT